MNHLIVVMLLEKKCPWNINLVTRNSHSTLLFSEWFYKSTYFSVLQQTHSFSPALGHLANEGVFITKCLPLPSSQAALVDETRRPFAFAGSDQLLEKPNGAQAGVATSTADRSWNIWWFFWCKISKWYQMIVQAHDLTHITAQQSHHVWRAPRKTQVTSRRWSHITDIIFWKNSLRAPMNPANRIFIFFSVQIKKSLRARSSYAIFERNVCIIHSRLHCGAGFDRLVIYASIMAIYIGALVLTGGKLRINHSRLHWGAGFDRLIVYASIIAVYIGAVALKGRKLCMN